MREDIEGKTNAGGDTPLHFAVCRGNVAVAGMLLRAEGATASASGRLLCAANSDGVTPLLAAAASGSHLCLQVALIIDVGIPGIR